MENLGFVYVLQDPLPSSTNRRDILKTPVKILFPTATGELQIETLQSPMGFHVTSERN